jgi:hypothetical protein
MLGVRAARNADTYATSVTTDKHISLVAPMDIRHVYLSRPSLTALIVTAYGLTKLLIMYCFKINTELEKTKKSVKKEVE